MNININSYAAVVEYNGYNYEGWFDDDHGMTFEGDSQREVIGDMSAHRSSPYQPEVVITDGGRRVAGYKGTAGDCGVRAMAIACEMWYRDVVDILHEKVKSERITKRQKTHSTVSNGIWVNTYKKMLESVGWEWVPVMKIGSGCTMHLRADEVPPGRIICRTSKHYVAVIDGVVHDTYDSSRGGMRCVYGYFRQKP